jgi:hypothetical protein
MLNGTTFDIDFMHISPEISRYPLVSQQSDRVVIDVPPRQDKTTT